MYEEHSVGAVLGRMRKEGRLAGAVGLRRGVPSREREEPLDHAHSGNPARLDHRLGPAARVRSHERGALQKVRRTPFDARYLLGQYVGRARAEDPGALLRVDGDLAETLVQDAVERLAMPSEDGCEAETILRAHRGSREDGP